MSNNEKNAAEKLYSLIGSEHGPEEELDKNRGHRIAREVTDMANEQEIKVLVAQLQQYEAEAQAVRNNSNVINFTINEIDNAIQSIDALSNPEAGADTLIPIGASSFVYVYDS